jgi:hypothetical protein
MRTTAIIAAILIVVLGLLHVGFTFVQYEGLSFDAVWFLGTGVAIILAGFLNIAMLRDRGRDTLVWAMTLLANLFFLIGFALASFMMRQPQVYVGAVLFGITTINCFFSRSPEN